MHGGERFTEPVRVDGEVKSIIRLCSLLAPLHNPPNLGGIDDWLKRHLPIAPEAIETVATGSYEAKADVLLNRNRTWFVEDRLETCFLLERAGITPVLFKQPWNRKKHPFIEVASWRELEDLIDYRKGAWQ